MTSEGLQNVKIKCRIAKAQRMSSAGLGKYVELREKLGFPKKKKLNYKDHFSEYDLHSLAVGESKFLSDVAEPERLALLNVLQRYNNLHNVKFIALRIKHTSDVELVRLV